MVYVLFETNYTKHSANTKRNADELNSLNLENIDNVHHTSTSTAFLAGFMSFVLTLSPVIASLLASIYVFINFCDHLFLLKYHTHTQRV